mmetsp:Transcript_5988/g.16772  ORF Transcript_5988/g.16772 Transcript_5988/m.16772 type:complete len:202 (+) Transcript_5988:733-1338(+)
MSPAVDSCSWKMVDWETSPGDSFSRKRGPPCAASSSSLGISSSSPKRGPCGASSSSSSSSGSSWRLSSRISLTSLMLAAHRSQASSMIALVSLSSSRSAVEGLASEHVSEPEGKPSRLESTSVAPRLLALSQGDSAAHSASPHSSDCGGTGVASTIFFGGWARPPRKGAALNLSTIDDTDAELRTTIGLRFLATGLGLGRA